MASADIGEFGPTDGRPVVYRFSPLSHAQGLIPWLLLPLVFVAFKENRTVQAAWILAPIVLLAIVYSIAMKILRPTSGTTVQLNVTFAVMALGFGMVWLLAERIGNRNRFVAFLLAALIYFGFLGASLLGGGLGEDATAIAMLSTISIPLILFAFLIAVLISLKSFTRTRFIACTGVTLFGLLLALMSFVAFYLDPTPSRPIGDRLAEVLWFSFLTSLVYFVGLLPFLILLFVNHFWRRRFEYVTGVRTNIE